MLEVVYETRYVKDASSHNSRTFGVGFKSRSRDQLPLLRFVVFSQPSRQCEDS